MIGRMLVFSYGVANYALFLGTYLYFALFLDNRFVPRSIDFGPSGDVLPSVATDLALLAVFAFPHSVMARKGFKARLTRYIPEPAERSTYMLVSSLTMILLFRQWRPLSDVVWDVEIFAVRSSFEAVYWAGWALIVASSFLLDHFALFGLRQVYQHLREHTDEEQPFRTPSLYRIVRHPIMLGKIIVFWFAPLMTYGHLLFSVSMTAYVLVGLRYEERDLTGVYGPVYEEYQRRVPMLLPLSNMILHRRRKEGAA